ncbi:cytochrome c oxidase subunit 2A [Bacillus sp. FJAT-47783]
MRQQTKEPSLKGTFLSVLMLGAFIFFSWIGIYYLFLIR